MTGSRAWNDRTAIETALADAVREVPFGETIALVHGMCDPRTVGGRRVAWLKAVELSVFTQSGYRGADWIADRFARRRNWTVEMFPADWSLGPKAGPERNALMVKEGADLCLAFALPNSRGTWDCVRKARAAGIETVVSDGAG